MPKKQPKYKDYIDYTQEVVRSINSEQSELIEKHKRIIQALRTKSMSVKELHNLFLDKETKKHSYTIKTIYRHLDDLEAAGLVTVAGHRVTKGSRVLEKLYIRTAKIFYKEMDEEYKKYKTKYYQTLLKNLHYVLSLVYEKPTLQLEELEKVLMPFYNSSHTKVDEIMERIEKDKKLAALYSSLEIDEINNLNQNLGTLMAFVAEPEILEKLRKLLK